MLEIPDRLIGGFDLLDIRDPRDLGPESRIARHLYDDEAANTYRLRDTRLRHLLTELGEETGSPTVPSR